LDEGLNSVKGPSGLAVYEVAIAGRVRKELDYHIFELELGRLAKMLLQREGEGFNWHTDDPARLYLSNTGNFSEAPTELSAFVIGRGGVIRPATRVVKLEALRLLGHGLFGESRPCGCGSNTRWTGNAYRFGIYEEPRKRVVIIRTDGSGTTVYAVDETDALGTWQKFIAALPSDLIWNLCMTLSNTYRKGRTDERQVVLQQFLEGKLRKRKRRGVLQVVILNESQ